MQLEDERPLITGEEIMDGLIGKPLLVHESKKSN